MTGAAPTVFVVDDEPSVRKALARLLRAAGYSVTTFSSAQEFLQNCNLDTPGCLLLDITMPGLNGLELQQILAARNAQWPIIFLTGRAESSIGLQAMNQGAAGFLTKPANDTSLLAAIERALQRNALGTPHSTLE